jgi:hypothetical protein
MDVTSLLGSALRSREGEDLRQAGDIGDEKNDEDDEGGTDNDAECALTSRKLVEPTGGIGHFFITEAGDTRLSLFGRDAIGLQLALNVLARDKIGEARTVGRDRTLSGKIFTGDECRLGAWHRQGCYEQAGGNSGDDDTAKFTGLEHAMTLFLGLLS